MFRKLLVVCFLAMSIAMFTGVQAQAKQTLRVGMGDPINSDQGALAKRLKSVIESLSNGEVVVELFPGGALGTETEMLQNTRMGTLDMSIVGVGNAVPFVKALGALTLPYLITDDYKAVKATTGGLGQYWNEQCITKVGFRIL